MKIAMVSEHANPLAVPGSVDAGGQNVHVAALARALSKRGHAVTVYTRRDSAAAPTRVPLDPGIAGGVEVVHLTAGPTERIPKDHLLPHMSELADGLREAWTFDRPDVVHSHFWMSGLAAVDAARALPERHGALGAPPVLHTFHALGSVKRRFQGAADTSPVERSWLEPLVGRRASTIIATCDDEVRELQALDIPGNRIEVAPCGVDLAEFDAEGVTEERGATHRLVSIGRLVPRKGVDLTIRALALLVGARSLDVELEIVGAGEITATGDDPETRRLRQLAEELGIADRVHFRGQISRERVPSILRSATAVVCAPWYEPFGIVPLESMACQAPVVAAKTGGLGDTVVDGVTGLHVPPQDAPAIAEAAARLMQEPSFGRALGAAGRLRVESRYSWERVAARTESIYERTIANAARNAHPLSLEGAVL